MSEKTTIIMASKPGQLGNSLFLYAHFVGFALENNYRVLNPSCNQYSDYFESTNGDVFCRFPKSKKQYSNSAFLKRTVYKFIYLSGRIISRLRIENSLLKCIYIDWDESFSLCNSEKNFNSRFVFIQGWKFRCPDYIKKHYDEIKLFFTPIETHRKKIDQLISETIKSCDLLIGVHVRHGDYKKFEGGKYYYTLHQYKEIMQKVKALFPEKKIMFLICSNSTEEMQMFNDMNTVKGTNHELEDMYAFASCNYLIGPPSTYTMWASFYGKVPLYQIRQPEKETITLDDFKTVVNG